jgi:glycogen synthase
VRIALATDWFAPRLGGIESQLVQLADGLGGRGHAVDVLTTTPRAEAGARFGLRAIDVARLPGVDVAVSPRLLSSLRRELSRGYEVVHAHVSVVSPTGYAAAFVARAMGIPTVVTFHSVLRAKRLLLSAAAALGGIARSPVAWTAVSTHVAGQARQALGTAVSVLPNGIDLGAWRRRWPRAARPAGAPITFVSTMRLHRKKRPVELVRAFSRAAALVDVPIRLVVVGVGPLERVIDAAMEDMRLSNPRVMGERRGRLSSTELRALYEESDAFILASRRESFGIAALEACAAGLPVIAMRDAGSGDFLAHDVNALLCDSDRDITDAIVRLARDVSLRSRLAQPSPLDRFDWPAVLAEHETTYQAVLATSPRPAVRPAVASSG